MIQTVFVNRENKAIFTCPKCTKAKTVDISKLLANLNKSNIKVKCPCGHIFPVALNRRKFYRKETSLHGTMTPEKKLKDFPMTVINLSRTGLEFKSSENKNMEVGEYVTVEFRLDDKSRSLIKKKVIIRKIVDNTAGGEFCASDEYDKVLGFYLFN